MIKVITIDDKLISLEEWQRSYGLNAHHTQIGKYFFRDEPIFARDEKDYGTLYVCAPLMQVMDAYRMEAGRALTANSYNRSKAKQAQLKARGFRTAEQSPHEEMLAVDIDTTSRSQTEREAKIVLQVAEELDIKVRVGYKDYLSQGQTFIHIDVCPEYFGVGKPRHKQKHPVAWERAYSVW